jgi:hypothetical protein
MAKIVLGKAPKHFKHSVSFALLDGGTGTIEFNFKYRTTTEYGKFIDAWQAKANEEGAATAKRIVAAAEQAEKDGGEVKTVFGTAHLMEATVQSRQSFILEVADGWNLDVEFTPESVLQLVDEFPQAAKAVIESYRNALGEGRLGN